MLETISLILWAGSMLLLVYMAMIGLLCLSDSKECYQCGERLDKYNTKKYRVSSNKGFCGSHCKDIYKRDSL